MMESLISLCLISLVVSFVLPLYIWVFQERGKLHEEQQILFQLEEKRNTFYVRDDEPGWSSTIDRTIKEYCKKSVVKKVENNCVYVFAGK
ncbi:hypothetical protein [Bacillus sp. JCM 19041]|uniref:hypothetical protein n=1 Tax=Bacillus sp. JCM 19041 TaxID=1460637 RepID=UPI0006D0468B